MRRALIAIVLTLAADRRRRKERTGLEPFTSNTIQSRIDAATDNPELGSTAVATNYQNRTRDLLGYTIETSPMRTGSRSPFVFMARV